MLAIHSAHAVSDLPAVRFNEYLKEEGLVPAQRLRAQAGRTNAPGREIYSRRAKALVQVGAPIDNQRHVTQPIGLTLESAEDGVVTLRLEPGAVGVVEEDERTYLHGGTLATCVDTAAWYAAASASEGDWLVTGLQLEALRLARSEAHRVIARCVRAGRTRAVVDVELDLNVRLLDADGDVLNRDAQKG